MSPTSSFGWRSLSLDPVSLVLLVLMLALGGLILWLALRLRRAEQRYEALTAGTTGGSVTAVLEQHVLRVQEAQARVDELEAQVTGLASESRSHIQRLGFLRYNPFRDAGGDQSFVVTLADGEGNGVVLSSLHGRDASRVYGKPLLGWESTYPLTDEERQAIKQARGDGRGIHGIQT